MEGAGAEPDSLHTPRIGGSLLVRRKARCFSFQSNGNDDPSASLGKCVLAAGASDRHLHI